MGNFTADPGRSAFMADRQAVSGTDGINGEYVRALSEARTLSLVR